jgi:hypothetical protein
MRKIRVENQKMDYIDFSLREEGSSLKEKGNKFPWGAISPMKQVFECLTKKFKGKTLSKSNVFISLETF